MVRGMGEVLINALCEPGLARGRAPRVLRSTSEAAASSIVTTMMAVTDIFARCVRRIAAGFRQSRFQEPTCLVEQGSWYSFPASSSVGMGDGLGGWR